MQKLLLVGILNLTPDSFSGDGVTDLKSPLVKAKQMLNDGASYLDIGAESTRPGAEVLSSQAEWARLEPTLKKLAADYPGKLSLDSHNPETIRKAFQAGSFIINDVTGFNNPQMISLAAELDASCIVSHLPKHLVQDIQAGHQPENKIDSVNQVRDELLETRLRLVAAGLKPAKIILDPGIGFGKTIETNWALLEFPKLVPDYPVMIGYSKKSFLGETRMSLERNLEAGRIAVAAGAKYLRLHADLLKAHYQTFIL